MLQFQPLSLSSSRKCFTTLIYISVATLLIVTFHWRSTLMLTPRKIEINYGIADITFPALGIQKVINVSGISIPRGLYSLPANVDPKRMDTSSASDNRIWQSLSAVTRETNSSFRWRKVFRDIFDVPDPLYYRLGQNNVTFKDRYIIYRCDNDTMQMCGGFADRSRGMFNAYLIANLTGRVFKSEIIMSDCEFSKFIIPNRVNWTLPTSFHKRVENNKNVTLLDMWANHTDHKRFRHIDWLHHWSLASDFVYMKSFHDLSAYFKESTFYGNTFQWMRNQPKPKLNRFLFQHLLRPSEYLQNKVVRFLTEHVSQEDKLICAHLRMGRNPTMMLDFRKGYETKDLPLVWNLFRELNAKYGNNTKIFIMSDSDQAIANARSQDFKDKVFVSSGDIIHIELSRNTTDTDKCDGLEKVIFELLILLHCDSLVITDSGLSRTAAYLRDRNDNLYCFFREGRLLPCKPNDLLHLYYPKS